MPSVKILPVIAFSFCMSIIFFVWRPDAAASEPSRKPAPAALPKAFVAEKTYAFDEVLEGDVVTHAYIIENRGAAPLQVLEIRTSCGCTTAQRPATIAPNAKDRIVVEGNTSGYGGRSFNKTISVYTNDPHPGPVQLQLRGKVAQFARIEPRYIALKGRVGEKIQGVASIHPNPKYPFHISATELGGSLGSKVAVSLEQHEGIYNIIVRNLVAEPQAYKGRIILKTDNPMRSQLDLFVRGNILGKE